MNKLAVRSSDVAKRYEFMMDSVQELGKIAWEMINDERVVVRTKPDGTLVTNVDETLNEVFIERAEEFGDIVWGEERSNTEKNDTSLVENSWLWLIDPIDGTKGFWRSYGNKRFSENTSSIMVTGFAPGETLPTMSVIHNPFQKQEVTISAHSGQTFYHTSDAPEPVAVQIDHQSTPKTLEAVQRFEQTHWRVATPDLDDFRTLVPRARLVDHQLFMGSVALGDVDVSVFPGPSNPHDVAPGALILHNAGGDVRTFANEPFETVDWRVFPIQGTVGTANPQLSRMVVEKVWQLPQNAMESAG